MTDDKIIKFFEHISDEYSLILLNWAYKKLGDKTKAEDLTQEVLLQVFSAVKRDLSQNKQIEKLDNLVWKVAHYVWCHYLRSNTNYKMFISINDLQIDDDSDFIKEFADDEEKLQLISRMREHISKLNYLQREIMILHYIENKSLKQISENLGVTESTIKWHLFNTRKKLKKEITTMNNNDFVYRPRKLHMAISGQVVPLLDIKMIDNSLTKQNVCIACYSSPKTLDELTEMLGIPKTYIEDDLKWLVEKEFIINKSGKYSTIFVINNANDENEIRRIYLKHKTTFSDIIINKLIAAEDKIREIGFFGCDKPMNKLLWLLIYSYNNYKQIPVRKDELPETPIRPDGGKYFPLGFDRTDFDSVEKSVDTTGWSYNGSMCSNGFHWMGLYNFGQSCIVDLIYRFTDEGDKQNTLLRSCIKGDIKIDSLDENGKFLLSKLIEKGFVRKEGNKIIPNLYVFTDEQYKQLEESVYKPISEILSDELILISNEIREYCKNTVPSQLNDYYGFFVKMALMDIGYITTIFAFNDGKLYIPKDNFDGEFLTFMFVE